MDNTNNQMGTNGTTTIMRETSNSFNKTTVGGFVGSKIINNNNNSLGNSKNEISKAQMFSNTGKNFNTT
jgi:hypothetical protein